MPLVTFAEMIDRAEQGEYAVGYFESWNLESLLAVADAAETTRSPVILGFSGIYLPHPGRIVQDPPQAYVALGRAVAEQMTAPACLLFNESPHFEQVMAAIDLGYDLVMYSNDDLDLETLIQQVKRVVEKAHRVGIAVEGEAAALAGVAGYLAEMPADPGLTDPKVAGSFVEQTGVDAFAVNIGQSHLHGRQAVRLDLERLAEIRRAISVPLVLHGATSIDRSDLAAAVRLGIRKINVSSRLKQAYFETMRRASAEVTDDYNPYEVIGSGLNSDLLSLGRVTMQQAVEEFMRLFGSAGRA